MLSAIREDAQLYLRQAVGARSSRSIECTSTLELIARSARPVLRRLRPRHEPATREQIRAATEASEVTTTKPWSSPRATPRLTAIREKPGPEHLGTGPFRQSMGEISSRIRRARQDWSGDPEACARLDDPHAPSAAREGGGSLELPLHSARTSRALLVGSGGRARQQPNRRWASSMSSQTLPFRVPVNPRKRKNIIGKEGLKWSNRGTSCDIAPGFRQKNRSIAGNSSVGAGGDSPRATFESVTIA
jgi:hypothetical protein